MNKKKLMILFSLVFFVSMFAVALQSSRTNATVTSYQTIEMSLSDPLYSTTSGYNGGSGCTASSTSNSYAGFSLNPGTTTQIELKSSSGFMAFNGFRDEQNNGSFVPFQRDPTNTSLLFPRDEGGSEQSPNFLDWSGDFQDRSPDWFDVLAVFDAGTQNPLTNTSATNHLVNFDKFDRIVMMDSAVPNPVVVAELHWTDCGGLFESDLVVSGFYDANHSFMPIRVNDSVSQFLDFSNVDGPPALLFPTANWYDMPQLNMSVTGAWNILDYNTGQTLEQNIANASTNILQSWQPGPDGSPELVVLTGLQSNTSEFVVSVKFYFQHDCSCVQWRWIGESQGFPFFTTLIDGKGAVNFTEYNFGFWRQEQYYGGYGPWLRELKGVYLTSEFDPSEPLQDGQSVATNYLDTYDFYQNIAFLKMKNATHHLDPGTSIVIVFFDDYCPPPSPCDTDFADVYVSGYFDENNTLQTFRAQGDKLTIDWYLDYFNLQVNKLDDPNVPFNFDKHVYRTELVGVFVNSTYNFTDIYFQGGNEFLNLLKGHGPDGQYSLSSAPGDQVDLLLVFKYYFEFNCPCVPTDAVIAALDFYNEITNQYIYVTASGNVVNLPPARPEPFFYEGMGPQEDRPPNATEILGVFASSTYNFSLPWYDQSNNLFLSYDEAFHQITLNSAPGDQEPLIIVMKLFWYCPVINECDGNEAPTLLTYSQDQPINVPVDSNYFLKLEFQDDRENFNGFWTLEYDPNGHLEDNWADSFAVIELMLGDYFNVVEGGDASITVMVKDDCGAFNTYNLKIHFTDNPVETTTDNISTTNEESKGQTITTTPGFELYAIIFGLVVVPIIIRKRK